MQNWKESFCKVGVSVRACRYTILLLDEERGKKKKKKKKEMKQ
jgi:hypothetical protein